jgi:hypothetical protein
MGDLLTWSSAGFGDKVLSAAEGGFCFIMLVDKSELAIGRVPETSSSFLGEGLRKQRRSISGVRL